MNVTIYISEWDGKNGSHALLKRAAADWCSCPESVFVLGEYGSYEKPFFAEPQGVEFSISHSGTRWLCAFGSQPLGLDAQLQQTCKREKLSKRFFHPKEDCWLERNDYEGFYQVWAAKESYLKYTGTGLREGMDYFYVADENGLTDQIAGVMQRHVMHEDLAVCVTGKEIETITWKCLEQV